MYPNFRVPESSVIMKVFAEQLFSGEATENLNSWEASDGYAACRFARDCKS